MEKNKLRTPNSYDLDADICAIQEENYNGIKKNSSLNSINYFHVCNPGLPPCIAHDLFEGIVPLDLSLCLNSLVKKKILSYDFINNNLKSITFYLEKKNYFPCIKKNDKLTGSATEIMWIIRTIPFAFHSKFELLSNTKEWEMILILRRICCMCLSFKMSIDQVAILRDQILSYITLRHQNFPNDQLKPKHHYLTHYPYLIRCFGPLRHLWTLRFESKHQFFKDAIRHTKNYKSVLYSLADKHQLSQIINYSSSSLFSNKANSNDANIFNIENIEPAFHNEILTNNYFLSLKYITSNALFRGVTYKSDMIICVKSDEYGNLVLCKIKHIFIDNNFQELFFFGRPFTVFYNPLTGLYHHYLESTNKQISNNNYILVDYDTLICKETVLMHIYEQSNEELFYFKSEPYQKY